MNGVQITVMLLITATLTALYYGGEAETAIAFPTFDAPTVELINLTGGCGSFTDCTEYLANVFRNIAAVVVATVQFGAATIEFLLDLFGFFINAVGLIVYTLQASPWYIQGFVGTVLIVTVALWLVGMLRKN